RGAPLAHTAHLGPHGIQRARMPCQHRIREHARAVPQPAQPLGHRFPLVRSVPVVPTARQHDHVKLVHRSIMLAMPYPDPMTGPLRFIGAPLPAAGRRDDPEGLGHGYVRLIARSLAVRGDHRTVLNRGIGGDRIGELRARWRADAIDPAPSVLTVYVGVNDTWRRFDAGSPTSAGHFETLYRGMLDEVRAAVNPRLILVEPFVVPVV